jgi:cytochrome oxidase Cu insertion factor (SCO1/SenC/PrrC family)
MKKFKIKASKIFYEDGPKKGEYEIDHTTRVYLMDSNNIYLDHLNPKLTEQQTAKVIVAKIVESEHRKDKA